MKILVIFLLALSLDASSIGWRGDFEKALLEAKSSSKDILLLLLKKDSSKEMFHTIFQNEKISKKINSRYIPVIAYFEDKNSYPIELFYTQDFPALFFVSSQDESFLKKPMVGDFSKEDLLECLK